MPEGFSWQETFSGFLDDVSCGVGGSSNMEQASFRSVILEDIFAGN
jgi:hypothetical protein